MPDQHNNDLTPVYDQLLRVASRLARNRADAEDLAHDAVVRLLSSRSVEVRDLLPWLRTVMTNLAVDHARRRRLHDQLVAGWLDEPGRDTADFVFDTVAQREACDAALRALLAILDPREVAAVLLREVFDWSHAELADALGKSEAATRKMINRAWRRFCTEAGPTTRRRRDDAFLDQIRLTCWHALLETDAQALQALVRGPQTESSLISAGSPHIAERPGTVATNIVQIGGRFALSLVLDGVVLCVIPIGDSVCALACER